jgi:hypothetical protein
MVVNSQLFNRIALAQGLVILLGLGIWALVLGWLGPISFGAGAMVASLGLWALHRFSSSLLGAKSHPLSAMMIASRLLIGGLLLYVILKTYEVHTVAISTGVLTPALAIVLAVLYEHFYARTS